MKMEIKNIRHPSSWPDFHSLRPAVIAILALLMVISVFGYGAASERGQAKRTIEEIESEYSQKVNYRFDPSGGIDA